MSKNIISGQHNSYDFIEIAGLKWATCNVGAEKPTDAGLYFQWGDRKGYTADEVGEMKTFDREHNKHFNSKIYTKYNVFDGKRTLDLCDDPAFAYMGHGWRIPTGEDFRRLVVNTTHRWANNYQNSGVVGMLFTDRTDESKELFFPAVGFCANGGVYGVGGFYWSSSLHSGDTLYGRLLYFNRYCVHWQGRYYRYLGFPVRGILTV